ncbi:DMT family transporter [Vagococcus carniphilus]|uniref:Multidrug efflux SMR transporter n=1 Tax=Vagococcus carniphilus TaxID=218144 RepID=A0A430AUF2_9ENTE|nr:multidrug efflux SMR transporter [Vagococcus carniphilus]MDT2814701.1 multidrug efflux SMR transporter [Vagococcus carniphilus]MDT2832021.1 multidrug efflux SMR transporter [Vagococcus carniphilus]MDT2834575.1 multidrug efflux SMR transporter [Vagococcus carniphilus]MDT2840838.1 multidrug efflux SMR transporter [Vagococcus carniphilus]MDT2848428.1 multidrug efflux SMR transporter [Vagococcus carniphilus]
MAWISLVFAGIFEMLGVNSINKYVNDKSKKNLLTLIVMFALSFILLSYSIESLPMSTAYAVWTGIGASGGAILGIVFYKEPKDAKRIFFIGLILFAAVGLKLIS